MHKKALLALLLVMTMLLSSCALIEKDPEVDRATEIIRVGDTVYTKGEIKDQVNYQISYMSYLYSMYGMSFDPTNAEMLATTQQDVIDFLIKDAVINQKVEELGLMSNLTEEEQAELNTAVEDAWQANLDSVKSSYFADTELTGEELDAAIAEKCAEIGLSKDSVMEGQMITIGQEKLREYIVKDVAVTDEELQKAFDIQVASDKSTFLDNPSYYGARVNNNTAEVFYRPAGYRMVKQILVKFNPEDQSLLDELNDKVTAQETAVTTAETALADMGVTDVDSLLCQVTVTLEQPSVAVSFLASETDLSSPVTTVATVTDVIATFDETVDEATAAAVKTLAEAKAVLAFYQNQVEAATDLAFANIDARTDEIVAQLDAGADWDTLMAEKTEDPGMQAGAPTAVTGYAVCENFANFDEAFVTASMALENVGDVSPKTRGLYGYYIIQYTAPVEEGPVALDEVRDSLTETELATKQETVYEQTLEQWVTEANAKVDYEALKD